MMDAREQGKPLMLAVPSDEALSISDVAARLTDSALELLRGLDARGDSVERELMLWRALVAELRQELRVRHFLPRGNDASLDGTYKRVVYRAALRVIAKRPLSSDRRTRRPARSAPYLAGV